MKIGVIVLARSNFGRWPDKIKAKLAGVSMIERVIERTIHLHEMDKIILSTTDYPEDKWLIDLASRYGIEYITGPPDDRGLRYYEAVKKYSLDYFMPMPANNPLFDIEALNLTTAAVREKPGYDYYAYAHAHNIGGVLTHIVDKKIIEQYKKTGTDQEMWFLSKETRKLFLLHGLDNLEIRNKYLIDLNVAYPLHVAILNKVIEHIGYYPLRYEELVEAFMEMKEL